MDRAWSPDHLPSLAPRLCAEGPKSPPENNSVAESAECNKIAGTENTKVEAIRMRNLCNAVPSPRTMPHNVVIVAKYAGFLALFGGIALDLGSVFGVWQIFDEGTRIA